MRRRPRESPELNAGFEWREVVCDSESAARAEVEHQQSLDDDEVAEWIYLKSEKTGQWLARRTPRHLEVETRQESLKEAFVTVFLNPFDWAG
jgi:hypothetical protein